MRTAGSIRMMILQLVDEHLQQAVQAEIRVYESHRPAVLRRCRVPLNTLWWKRVHEVSGIPYASSSGAGQYRNECPSLHLTKYLRKQREVTLVFSHVNEQPMTGNGKRRICGTGQEKRISARILQRLWNRAEEIIK